MATGRPTHGYVTPTSNGSVAPAGPGIGQRLSNVENVTQAVLWVGIISLVAVIFTAVSFVVQTINQDTQSRLELNKSVQELNAKIDAQNKK